MLFAGFGQLFLRVPDIHMHSAGFGQILIRTLGLPDMMTPR